MSAARHDVAIIGGGLAGCAAAILLAERGLDVLLLERGRYPRHKMCGEFLSPESLPMLERLGVGARLAALGAPPIRVARITTPDGRRLDLPLPAGALGVSRYRLDALLAARAREAGATVLERRAVSRIEGTLDQGFLVGTRDRHWEARSLLGAWGKRGTPDRTLERPFFARRAGFLALKRHLRGPDPGERTELHVFPGGYCGLNRVEGGAVNACLLATEAAWARAGRDVATFWAMIARENPSLGAQLAGAEPLGEDIVISNISFTPRSTDHAGLLMLGDSAALISPLAGNGQAMALASAFLAAPLVAAFLAGELDAAGLRATYRRAWQERFRERLLLGRVLQPLFLRPRLLSPALSVVRAVPALGRRLVAGTRERAGYPGDRVV